MGELNQRCVVRPLRGNPPGVDGDRAEVTRSLYCRRNTISPSRVPFSGCCSSGMCSCTVPALATCASSLPLPWAVRLSQRPPVRVRYLWRRALPLEHAVARECRKDGARVAGHVCLADMNDRRLEVVVANGLPLWHGSQLALDATIVLPPTRSGGAHPRADVPPGLADEAAAKRKRRDTYPELGRPRRCRAGGRCGAKAAQLLRPFVPGSVRSTSAYVLRGAQKLQRR